MSAFSKAVAVGNSPDVFHVLGGPEHSMSGFTERMRGLLLADVKALPVPTTQAAMRITVSGRTAHGDGYADEFYWDASDLSAEVAADTVNGEFIALTASPGVPGAAGAYRRDTIGKAHTFAAWFGILGDGADNTAAFAALAALKRENIILPLGHCYSLNTIAWVDQDIIIRGHGRYLTNMRFGPAVDSGITITQNSTGTNIPYKTRVEGLSISAGKLALGPGLTVDYSGTSSLSTIRNYFLCQIVDVETRGVTDEFTEGWKMGILTKEVQRLRCAQISCLGYRDNTQLDSSDLKWFPHSASGLHILNNNNLQPTLTVLDDISARYCANGISAYGTMEGFILGVHDFVACNVGVYLDFDELVGSDGAADPHVMISDGHCNCASGGYYLANTFANHIHNNLIYRFARVDKLFTGIMCYFGNDRHIHNNKIYVSNATGAPVNPGYGIYIMDVNQSMIHDNFITNPVHPNTFTFEPIHHESGTLNEFRNNTARQYDGVSHKEHQLMFWGAGAEADNTVSNYKGVVAEGQTAGASVTTTATDIVTVSLPNPPAGSKFRVTVSVSGIKTGNGDVRTYMQKAAGTATVVWGVDDGGIYWQDWHGTGVDVKRAFSGIMKVTATGSLSVRLRGICTAGSFDVAVGDAEVLVERLA